MKLLLTVALATFLFVAVRPALRVLERRYRPTEELSADIFALLLVGVFVTGAAADRIGVQALTGGFLFGAAVPQLPGLARAVTLRLENLVVIMLIVGLIGLQAGVLTEQMMAVFVLGAIATTLMTGTLFDRFSPKEAIPSP